MSKSLKMKVATQAIIAGLTLASAGIGAGFTASTAFADQPEAAAAQTVLPQNIDFTKKATLHIVKLTGDHLSQTKDPTGEQVKDTSPETPLKGAVFQIQKLNYDFQDPDAFAMASKLTPKDAASHVTGEPITSQPTGTDGVATFTNLDLGAYLVKETTAPQGRVAGPDFIAFLPSTSSNGNGWNYDVYAYPKNTSPQVVSKELSTVEGVTAGTKDNGTTNANANSGDTVYYDVSAKRPALDPKRQYFKQFAVFDKYSSKLTPKTEDTSLYKLSIGKTVLAYGTDFTVGTKNDNGTKYWYYNLTKDGLTKLGSASDSAPIKATFPFTVGSATDDETGFADNNVGGVTSSNGDITPGVPPTVPENPVFPTPNPKNPNTPESPKTENHWVKVKFTKTDEGSTALQGAKFSVYRCTKDNGTIGLDTKGHQAKLQGKPLNVGGKDEFTSAGDGAVTINSLRVVKDAPNTQGYCLVETHAPKVGETQYALLQSPYFFHVTATKSGDSYKYASDIADNATVKDRESNVPKLPATGGVGVGLLMALGIVIVGGGAYYARRSTKAEA